MADIALKPKPKNRAEFLSIPVNFRLSKRSYKALQKLAAKEGLRTSPFLRTHVHKLLNEQSAKGKC